MGVLRAMDDDYNANLTYALNYNGQGGPFAVQPDGTVITTRLIDYEQTLQLELFAGYPTNTTPNNGRSL